MKKNFGKVLFLFGLVFSLGFGFICLGSCSNSSQENQELSTEGLKLVTFKINPEVSLLVNENEEVVEVSDQNEDAEIILSDTDLTGSTVEEAAESFIELADEAGYVKDPENVQVTVDVEDDGNSTEETEVLKEHIKKGFEKYFKNHGFFGKISEATLEEYSEQAKALDVSCGQMKLILKALDLNADLTMDDVSTLSMKELISLIHTSVKDHDFGPKLNQDYHEEVKALKEKYAEMFSLKEEIEDLTLQLENPEITDEERTELTTSLTEKTTRYTELNTLYCEEMNALKAKYKELKQERKTTCQNIHSEKCNTAKQNGKK